MRFDVRYETFKVGGQTVQKEKTAYEPQIFFEGEPWKQYLLLMVDPDAPAGVWLHWLVSNIPGNIPEISQGDFIQGYAPPNPPSGTHRYFFILYEQPSSLMIPKPNQRGHFDVAAFERDYKLRKVAGVMVRVSA